MQTTSPEPSGCLGNVLTDMLLAIWLATSAAAILHMVLLINITAIPSLRLQPSTIISLLRRANICHSCLLTLPDAYTHLSVFPVHDQWTFTQIMWLKNVPNNLKLSAKVVKTWRISTQKVRKTDCSCTFWPASANTRLASHSAKKCNN